jgi:predicted kinase
VGRTSGTDARAATAATAATAAAVRPALPAPRAAEPVPRLTVPPDSLVVLAGLPGAGKTTLLRQVAAGRPARVLVLDSEEVAARLREAGVGLPYGLLRPLVHALHLLRVVRAARHPAACVLTTDPMTSQVRRALLAAAARAAGRTLHLVLLDATHDEARRGQRERGRALGRRRMERHVRRWAALRAGFDRTGRLPLVTSAVVLPRARARVLARVDVRPARPGRAPELEVTPTW